MLQDYKLSNRKSVPGEVKCESCGKVFKPSKPHFKTCYACHSKQQNRKSLPENLLLRSYCDDSGNIKKEIFIGVPETLATIFARDGLKNSQLRDFHCRISRARNKCVLKGIDTVRPMLWECQKHSAYQVKRQQIPESFVMFIKHHIQIAEKSEENLEGFYQHFDAVVCYFPK